jgi:hypothetical protein
MGHGGCQELLLCFFSITVLRPIFILVFVAHTHGTRYGRTFISTRCEHTQSPIERVGG